jgi:hypothetical protein
MQAADTLGAELLVPQQLVAAETRAAEQVEGQVAASWVVGLELADS